MSIQDEDEIRRLHFQKGWSFYAIARKFHITKREIAKIISHGDHACPEDPVLEKLQEAVNKSAIGGSVVAIRYAEGRKP